MSQKFPEQEKPVIDVSEACYSEIRQKLIAQGSAGTIIERPGLGRCVDCGEFVIRTGFVPRHRNWKTAPFPIPENGVSRSS